MWQERIRSALIGICFVLKKVGLHFIGSLLRSFSFILSLECKTFSWTDQSSVSFILHPKASFQSALGSDLGQIEADRGTFLGR